MVDLDEGVLCFEHSDHWDCWIDLLAAALCESLPFLQLGVVKIPEVVVSIDCFIGTRKNGLETKGGEISHLYTRPRCRRNNVLNLSKQCEGLSMRAAAWILLYTREDQAIHVSESRRPSGRAYPSHSWSTSKSRKQLYVLTLF